MLPQHAARLHEEWLGHMHDARVAHDQLRRKDYRPAAIGPPTRPIPEFRRHHQFERDHCIRQHYTSTKIPPVINSLFAIVLSFARSVAHSCVYWAEMDASLLPSEASGKGPGQIGRAHV